MKRLLLLSVVLAAAVLLYAVSAERALSFGGCEEDCTKCHAFSQKEAEEMLGKLKMSGARVLGITMSPVRGLWELAVDDHGKRTVLYVGFAKKHIMGGPIVEVDTTANKTKESLDALNRPPDRYVDAERIPLEGSLVMGERDARYRVIVFTDPDCPYCGRLHGELKKVLGQRRDIVFYIKLMPLKIHPEAYWKAQSIVCSGSLELLESNFDKHPIPRPTCETTLVDETLRTGGALGITGTPTLVLPDGLVVAGVRDAAAIAELVNKHKRRGET